MPSLQEIVSGISNADFWNEARRMSPTFRSHTSKVTSDFFTEKGFNALKVEDVNALNEWFELSMRIVFQMFNVSTAKDPLAKTGIVQTYATEMGGYTQRIAIESLKPTSPRYLNLEDGDSVDMQSIRKSKQSERMFRFNTNYQSFVSLSDFQQKTLFTRPYGMGEFYAGIMTALRNGYTIQRYEFFKEVINGILHNVKWPLQDTQVVRLSSWTDAGPTDAQLKELLLSMKDVLTSFEICSQTSAYNAYKFKSAVETGDLVAVFRPGIKNRITMNLEAGIFHPDKLSLPVESYELEDFGGLTPYITVENVDIPLQPIYDKNGEQVAYVDATVTVNGPAHFDKTSQKWIVNVTSGGTTADTNQTVTEEAVSWSDPNEEVLGFICQKGIIWEAIQNPYTVRPAYPNVAGLYQNLWASSPNNGINYDPLYNFIAFCKPAAGS